MIDLTFDGSTDARGKNHWFQLRRGLLHVSTTYPHDAPAHPVAHVWLYSKHPASVAPIVLDFNQPEELRTLICGLAKALAQMTTITEKEDPHGEVA